MSSCSDISIRFQTLGRLQSLTHRRVRESSSSFMFTLSLQEMFLNTLHKWNCQKGNRVIVLVLAWSRFQCLFVSFFSYLKFVILSAVVWDYRWTCRKCWIHPLSSRQHKFKHLSLTWSRSQNMSLGETVLKGHHSTSLESVSLNLSWCLRRRVELYDAFHSVCLEFFLLGENLLLLFPASTKLGIHSYLHLKNFSHLKSSQINIYGL